MYFWVIFHLPPSRLFRKRLPSKTPEARAVRKEDIEPPEPGSLPPRISFIEQMGGSAGYYVRFKDLPDEDHPEEDHLEEEGPIRKYVPILQFESQKEALQAAIEYRNRKAEELGLPREPKRLPHPEEAKEKMSDSHNRLGLRGLGLSFTWRNGTGYPALRAMWSEEGGQKKVSRGMASRGLHGTMEELAPHLQEHLHPEKTEEELIRKGVEAAARLLLNLAAREEPESPKKKRIESLFQRWADQYSQDQEALRRVLGE